MPVPSMSELPRGDSADLIQELTPYLRHLNKDVWDTYSLFTLVEHQIQQLSNDLNESPKLAATISRLSVDWAQCSQKGADAFVKVISTSADPIVFGNDPDFRSSTKNATKHKQYMQGIVDSLNELQQQFLTFKTQWDKLHSDRSSFNKIKRSIHTLGTQVAH
ncbi:hypothetical protein K474DRAFT_1675499 [Panus rudis PR-1116 ss-1]|nr:hypothetical protein K474DRAFT_1675499 [Panus rudis PR-1116 ss-1]